MLLVKADESQVDVFEGQLFKLDAKLSLISRLG
jgi:hypothetical protein